MRIAAIESANKQGGDPYENLANAIIIQAVKDYTNGYRKEECEKFFNSEWYRTLTELPSECIIKIANQCSKVR